jgi:hypothetical protein
MTIIYNLFAFIYRGKREEMTGVGEITRSLVFIGSSGGRYSVNSEVEGTR